MNNQCLHQIFEAQVMQHPDAVAVRCGEANLTYQELNGQANQLAHHLRQLDVGPEVLVGLHIDRSIEAIIGMLAILKAGGAYVPLDPAYPSERLAYMLQDTQLSVLITHSQVASTLPDQPGKTVFLDRDAATIGRQPAHNPDSGVAPDNLMYVIYTSGSTGKPKGIMVSHANVARLFPASQPYLHFDKTDTWTLFHSYSFGFSVWEIWGALYHGGRLVVVPPAVSQSPGDFYELVCREQITVLSQTPSAFSLFLLADEALHQTTEWRLRYIVFSGEPLEPALLAPWFERHGDDQPQLINMYAITETAGEITYRRLLADDATQASRSNIGVPLPDVQIHLLDEQQQPVPVGEVGEMYIGSPAVARGYLNLPELTAEKFLPDPFRQDHQARLYKTGDRARQLPNGELEFVGRVDDQVKIRGYRVEPSEITGILTRHAAIQEAVVVAQSETHQTRLVAYVVPRAENGPLTTTELQQYLKNELPDYMIPNVFVKLDRLPRSPNGKLDRHQLPKPGHSVTDMKPSDTTRVGEQKALASMWGLDADPVADRVMSHQSDYVAPQTPIEKEVAQIWQEILGLPRVGLQDDFFKVGGNAIGAEPILQRINDAFRLDLSMSQFKDRRTVAEQTLLIIQNQLEQLETEEVATLLAELGEFSEAEIQHLLEERPDIADEMRQHETYMRLAINKAQEAIEHDQIPVAACIVKDGQVISCVHNEVWHQTDATAHAEIQAIRIACRQLNTIDLSGCVLYSTLEPCPMCLSASHWANISKIVYGVRRQDAARFGLTGHTLQELATSPLDQIGDTLRDDNLQLFERWLTSKKDKPTQYDHIADQFKQTRNSLVNRYITDYTFFEMIGELDQKAVLELACGEGHYSRMMKQRDAARVVGIDISASMINLAKQQEAQESLGIEYLCQDVLQLEKLAEFDLVVAGFLLHYAQTKEQLLTMCQVAFDNLKLGGYFILLNENPEQSPADYQGYEQYGYHKTMAEPYQEGSIITYTMSTGTGSLQFEAYYWRKATYDEALKRAGFKTITWQPLLLSPQGKAEYGDLFWQNYLDNPPIIGIMCQK